MRIKNIMIFPFYILLLIKVVGCKSSVPPIELIQYIENSNNGLHIKKQEGNIELDLQFKSVDYLIVQENRSKTINKEVYQKLKNELNGVIYFNLNISLVNGMVKMDPTLKNQVLASFFQFEFRNNLHLQVGSQILPCSLYHNQNNMGIYPYSTFVIGFKYEGEIDDDLTFIVAPAESFPLSMKNTTFLILKKDIQNIPSLKLH